MTEAAGSATAKSPAAGAATFRSHPDAPAPLVSVVVSTRNHAQWLGRTVDAVMNQDLDRAFEMIVVDNASTDETPTLMAAAITRATHPLTYVRLASDKGPAGGRNEGLDLAAGAFIAFTDSDCTPSPRWLKAGLDAFSSPAVGIVQGRTKGAGGSQPFFSHFIDTPRVDGSFSTSNVIYRRAAIGDRRFDPSCRYWEDVDLGWRVFTGGWTVQFAPDAVIEHEAVPLTPVRWLLWARNFGNWPAKVARYPGYRRYLTLGVWVSPLHLWFDLAVVSTLVAPWYPLTLVLVVPYAVEFVRTRGLGGRFPPAKVVAHVAWDVVSFWSLVTGSVRYRCLVL